MTRALKIAPHLRAMAFRSLSFGLAAAITACCSVTVPLAADDITAISTGGKGELTKCSYEGCLLYHHVALPLQLTLGDKVRLWYGSNPKHYFFPVAKIVREGEGCTVLSQADPTENVDKIDFGLCKIISGNR
jgi:hypothetical protein